MEAGSVLSRLTADNVWTDFEGNPLVNESRKWEYSLFKGGIEAGKRITKLSDLPTGIVCGNDATAIGVIQYFYFIKKERRPNMKGKKLFEIMNKGKMPSRIPFVPTIYEHAARVINKTPALLAQDEDLMVKGQLASYEKYKHDLVSVGLDIYNIECEALGAEVNFKVEEDLPYFDEILIKDKKDLKELKIPDPEKDKRMPLFLNTAARINEKIGQEVTVNGTVVGPFTLAALLRGFENYIYDIIRDTDFALEVMKFAARVSLKYADAFLKRGVGISINESWISPPLLSPDLYKNYVFEEEKKLIRKIKDKGGSNVALISGGNTTPIAEYMVETGSSLLIADYNTDQKYFKDLCKNNDIFLRASIEPGVLEKGSKSEMKKQTKKVINACSDYHKFIFGCGVVSYDTPVNKVLKLKNIVKEIGVSD